MNTTSINQKQKASTKSMATETHNTFTSVRNQYRQYCIEQNQDRIYWYMKAIIIIPCVIMVPSIIAFYLAGQNHEYYVGFCMVLFAFNLLAHISELTEDTLYLFIILQLCP